MVNFDTFAFNSSLIRSITLSLNNLLQFNSLDPCPVILLPEISTGIIGKVEAILQTGTCSIRDRVEAQEVLEVSNLLGLPISMLVPENRSGVDTSSPIILSNAKVKTEIPNPDPEENLFRPRSSFRTDNGTASISNSASSEARCVEPDPEPSNMVKGYKCAICKRPGGNVPSVNKKETIFQTEMQLEAHYIGQHFKEEIGKHVKDKDTCGICGKNIANGRLHLHIGLIHKKIKSILRTAKISVQPTFIRGAPVTKPLSKPSPIVIPTIISPKIRKPLALTYVPTFSPKPSQIVVSTTESENSPPAKSDNIAPSPKTSLTPISTPKRPLPVTASVGNSTCPVVSTPPGKMGYLKGSPRKTPQGSGKKTQLSKPTLPVHLTTTMSKDGLPPSTPKRLGMSPPGGSGLLGEKRMSPGVGQVTPDNMSRRFSIQSNCETPDNVVNPVDEFMTKWDSKPERGSNKKPLTTKNCNFDLTCEVCGEIQKTFHAMDIHIIGHYKEDLEAKVSCHMTENNECKICGDAFKGKSWLVNHLGSKHGYINEVLGDKGFAVLPCPVNSKYSASKQKQLVKIKKERKRPFEEKAKELDDLRDQLMKDTD